MSRINSLSDPSYSSKIKAIRVFRTVVCVLLCALSIFPFYIMIVNSTLDSKTIEKGIRIIPGNYFFKNISGLAEQSKGLGLTIFSAMKNSFLISAPATVLQVYFATFTAYGIVTYQFKLRNLTWSFIMAIMMIPPQVSVIGFMRMLMQMNLYNNYLPLIIPAIAAPSTIYFMKQYMTGSLSHEIIEAARIDGSGEFATFNKIVIPLMKPAMATQAIFAFIAAWNNLYIPSMIITTSSKKTLPMFMQTLRSEQFRNDYGIIYLGLFLTVLPIFVVYFALSKYIIAGVALGGVKE